MTQIAVGSKVGRFTLSDQHGEPFSRDDEAGKKLILSFHPLAWTPLCARQMKALEASRNRFLKENAVAFGVSVDAPPSKLAWAKELGIRETRLLSDFWPHGAVSRRLGVFRAEDGFSERAVIILDERRRMCFSKVYPLAKLPDLREVFAALNKIGG